MSPRPTTDGARTAHGNGQAPSANGAAVAPVNERRPFRAADVLTGAIDRRRGPAARGRKQISAQLEPAQLRLLGELHARLNATAATRIEKSDLVGLGIELLAAVLDGADGPAAERGKLAPAPGERSGPVGVDGGGGVITDLADLRVYLRTHVRAYAERG